MALEIEEVTGGFDLKLITSEPFDNIPIQIAFDFAPGGIFDFDNGIVQGNAGQVFFLKDGIGIYQVGQDAISIGPGVYTHRMWDMRNSESAPYAFRVLMTLTTPVIQTIQIRCGTWNEASMSIR